MRFIAATVPVEKAGDVNPVMEAANQLADSLEGVEKKKNGLPSLDGYDPENPPMPDLNEGSFERFMGTMANPAKWAGR